jgi:hypothetical protein
MLIAAGVAAYQLMKNSSYVGAEIFVIIALLAGVRVATQRQKRKREQMLKEVPRRPLGL